MKSGFCASKKGERGAMLLLFTMMVLLVVIPLIGLAVDGAVIFWAKARLSAAVDAAALAAGRSINMQQTTAQNRQPVIDVANAWFNANFPVGWLGVTLQGPPVVTPSQTSYSIQQVDVSATANVPLFFLRLAGVNSVQISASGQSARRNSFVVLVLDRSGSINSNNGCAVLRQDSTNFVNMFTEGFDSLALVTFSTTSGPAPDYGPSNLFKSGMAGIISTIQCTGSTNTTQALNVAYKTIQANGLAGGLNVIVLFTDGQPNGVTADYPVRRLADSRYYYDQATRTTVFMAQPASGCPVNTPDTITGSLSQMAGLYDTATQIPPYKDASLVNAPTCYFKKKNSYWVTYDLAYIPTIDKFGNKTNAGYGSNSPYYGPGLGTTSIPEVFPAGQPATYAYPLQIRPDKDTTGSTAVAENTADYQAQVIRADTTFNTVIFTIGLGAGIDSTLLERIANDPRSPIYDSAKTQGYFAFASNPNQLNQAFTTIAGQILRLSR